MLFCQVGIKYFIKTQCLIQIISEKKIVKDSRKTGHHYDFAEFDNIIK